MSTQWLTGRARLLSQRWVVWSLCSVRRPSAVGATRRAPHYRPTTSPASAASANGLPSTDLRCRFRSWLPDRIRTFQLKTTAKAVLRGRAARCRTRGYRRRSRRPVPREARQARRPGRLVPVTRRRAHRYGTRRRQAGRRVADVALVGPSYRRPGVGRGVPHRPRVVRRGRVDRQLDPLLLPWLKPDLLERHEALRWLTSARNLLRCSCAPGPSRPPGGRSVRVRAGCLG